VLDVQALFGLGQWDVLADVPELVLQALRQAGHPADKLTGLERQVGLLQRELLQLRRWRNGVLLALTIVALYFLLPG
jgi:hypothetical protein